jgi:hypothetical protein
MQTAADWLGDQLKTAAGHVGTYYRNQTAYPNITAPVAEKTYEEFDQRTEGATAVLSYDWTFKAADLPVTPRAGDLWKPTINGTEETYEVIQIAGQPFMRLDTSGILIGVHTNRIR